MTVASPKKPTLAEDPIYPVDKARELLGGMSKATLYSYFSRGKLAKVKVGSRVFVRASSLEALVKE